MLTLTYRSKCCATCVHWQNDTEYEWDDVFSTDPWSVCPVTNEKVHARHLVCPDYASAFEKSEKGE